MGVTERFKRSLKQTGMELVSFEAEKIGISPSQSRTDIETMMRKAVKIGGFTGLTENEITDQLQKGANSSRGARNDKVKGKLTIK